MLINEIREAVNAAMDLGYLPETIQKLWNAESTSEISRIMATARTSGELGAWFWG